jgi:hypothetical protein
MNNLGWSKTMTDNRRSRKDFLSLTGAGIAGALGAGWPSMVGAAGAQGASLRAQDADLVVYNARVYTVDPRPPRAEAFAVKNTASSPSGVRRRSGGSPAKGRSRSTPRG